MVRLYIAKLVTSLPAPSVLRNIIVIFTVKNIVIIAFVLNCISHGHHHHHYYYLYITGLFQWYKDVDLSKGQVF